MAADEQKHLDTSAAEDAAQGENSTPGTRSGEGGIGRGGTESDDFVTVVKKKEKLRARRREQGEQSIWFGIGMYGVIGWSVAIPTLIGVGLGYWLDRIWPVTFSWTLTLMVVGVVIGCFNAWYWVSRQRRKIDEFEQLDDDND
jgi:ATP synthase protein I